MRTLLLSFTLLGCMNFCFGQASTAGTSRQNAAFKRAPMYNALFVLRSHVMTMVLDPRKNEIFDIRAIDRKNVKYVSILSSREAKKLYGDKGAYGAVIVQFADDYAFSKETLVTRKTEN